MDLSARLVVLGAFAIAACGFDGLGTGPDALGTSDLVGHDDAGATKGGADGGGGVFPPDNHDATVGPPVCDPATDPSCLALPAGWRLIAAVAIASPPACPDGYAAASDVVSGPTARANACDCGACTIAQKPSCAGAVQVKYSYGNFTCDTGDPTQSNNPPGGCGSDMYTGDQTSENIQYTMPAPSGATCTPGPAVAHDDRVDFAEHARLCDGNARCAGATCDARVTAPFRACFSKDGDVACPSGFAEKHLVGTAAALVCAPTCGCNVNAQTCSPVMNMYSLLACKGTPVSIPIDGTCRASGFSGSYRSYAVTTVPAATCVAMGASAPSNVTLTKTTTVCCR